MNNTHKLEEISREIKRILETKKIAELTLHTIGLLGNILMIFVYSRGTKLRKLSVSVYFRCEAFFCACNNVSEITNYFVRLSTVMNQSDLSCQLIGYLTMLLIPMAVWFEVCASWDRFLTIVFPTRFQFIQKKLVQRTVVASTIVLIMSTYSVVFLWNRLELRQQMCLLMNFNQIRLVDLIMGSLLPFILMVVLSLATLAGVLRAHKRLKSMMVINNKRARDVKFGVTMLVVNLVFFVLNFPEHLNLVFNLNPYNDTVRYFVFGCVLVFLYEIYYSIVFYVQLAVNSIVRRDLCELILRKRRFGR